MADRQAEASGDAADGDGQPQVVDLDSEDADVLLDALSSETARSVLSALYDEPLAPPAVAERVDTSLQNVHYHLDNLEEAGAIEVIDTDYSEKGREMNVYAPTEGPMVVLTGRDQGRSIRTAVARLFGGVAVIAAASLAVQYLFGGGILDGGSGAPATTTPGPSVSEVTTAPPTGGAGTGLPPGLLFFAGGVTALALWLLVWYVRTRPTSAGDRSGTEADE